MAIVDGRERVPALAGLLPNCGRGVPVLWIRIEHSLAWRCLAVQQVAAQTCNVGNRHTAFLWQLPLVSTSTRSSWGLTVVNHR